MEVTDVVIGAIVSGAISLAVGYATARLYGPRWALKETRKREHSLKLNEALTRWLNDLNRYCRIGVAFKGYGPGDFSPSLGDGGGVVISRYGPHSFGLQEWKKIELRKSVDPTLEYFAELRSHLQVYAGVLNHWDGIKNAVDDLNLRIFEFLKDLGRELFLTAEGKSRGTFQTWDGQGVAPNFYFLLNDVIYLTWKCLKERASEATRPPYETPLVRQRPGEGRFGTVSYEVSWTGGFPPLVETTEQRLCVEISSKISHICESAGYVQKVKEFLSREAQLATDVSQLRGMLQEAKEQVDLGNNLKGDCSYCP